MKKIRSYCGKWYAILPLAFIMLMTGCDKASNLVLPESSLKSSYTGEDIFKALYFGEGEAAKLLPKYTIDFSSLLTDPEQRKEVLQVETDIISRMKEQNPSFFTNFEAEIKSGNLSRIKQAIISASKSLVIAVEFGGQGQTTPAYPLMQKKIINEFNKDKGNALNPTETMALLRTDKYKEMFKQLYSTKKVGESISMEQPETDVWAYRETYVYLWVAAVAGAVILIAIFLATEESTVFTTGDEQADQLKQQQMIAAVSEAF